MGGRGNLLFPIHGVILHPRRNPSQDTHLHTCTHSLPLFGPLPACGPGCGTQSWLCVSCRAAAGPVAWDCDWRGCAFGTPSPVCRDPVVCAFQVSRKGTGSAGPWATPVSYSGLPFAFPGKGNLCPAKLRMIIKKVGKCNFLDHHHRKGCRAGWQLEGEQRSPRRA